MAIQHIAECRLSIRSCFSPFQSGSSASNSDWSGRSASKELVLGENALHGATRAGRHSGTPGPARRRRRQLRPTADRRAGPLAQRRLPDTRIKGLLGRTVAAAKSPLPRTTHAACLDRRPAGRQTTCTQSSRPRASALGVRQMSDPTGGVRPSALPRRKGRTRDEQPDPYQIMDGSYGSADERALSSGLCR
jgi:hypothetical protein